LQTNNQAQVLFGNLISLPVGNGMLYVEPVYVKSGQQTNAAPLLQKVLMSYGDGGTYVVLANNLQDGLKALVAQGKNQAPPPPTTSNNTNPPAGTQPPASNPQLTQATADLDKAIADVRAAQQSGDFARYGQALQALETAMTNYQNAQKTSNGAAPSAGPSAPASTPASAPPSAVAPTPSGG